MFYQNSTNSPYGWVAGEQPNIYVGDKHWHYLHQFTGSTPLTVDLSEIATNHGYDAQGIYIIAYGGNANMPGRQGLASIKTEGGGSFTWISDKPYAWDGAVPTLSISDSVITMTFGNTYLWFGLRKL